MLTTLLPAVLVIQTVDSVKRTERVSVIVAIVTVATLLTQGQTLASRAPLVVLPAPPQQRATPARQVKA